MTTVVSGALALLDQASFEHFAPLLEASQEYASHSGCRFRRGSFDGIPTVAATLGSEPLRVGVARGGDSGLYLAAKIKAAPFVADFAERLRAGEAGLVEEVERAFNIVIAESVRNAMIGMCQAMDMFPPSPAPMGVDDKDCSYEDTSVPLPIISQRLYNDQVRRLFDAYGGPSRVEQRALTAVFITDFAEDVGVRLPEIPKTQRDMLSELAARVEEATDRQGKCEAETASRRDAFLGALGVGAAAERLREDAKRWAEKCKPVAVGAAIKASGERLRHRVNKQLHVAPFSLGGLDIPLTHRAVQQCRLALLAASA